MDFIKLLKHCYVSVSLHLSLKHCRTCTLTESFLYYTSNILKSFQIRINNIIIRIISKQNCTKRYDELGCEVLLSDCRRDI